MNATPPAPWRITPGGSSPLRWWSLVAGGGAARFAGSSHCSPTWTFTCSRHHTRPSRPARRDPLRHIACRRRRRQRLTLLNGRRGQGEGEDRTATALWIVEPHAARMRLDDPFDNWQSKTGAFGCNRLLAPDEAIEDAVAHGRRHAWAVVDDSGHDRSARARSDVDLDGRCGGRIPVGVHQ